MKYNTQKATNHRGVHSLFFTFLAIVFTIVCSLQTAAQSICVANIENGNAEICLAAGASKTFSNSTATGAVIDWLSSGDGTFNNPSLANPTYTPGPQDIANGYVFIYLDVYNDDPVAPCSALPVATILLSTLQVSPATQTICSGTQIGRITLRGIPSGITYNWTRNNTTAVTGIASSGTSSTDIRGTLTNTTTSPVTVTFTLTPISCAGTPIVATVLVNPRPNAVRTPVAQTICSGATMTPVTLTGGVSGTTYNWTRDNTAMVTGIAASGSGDISGALINTTVLPVTATFTITPTANNCVGTAVTATTLVNPVPNAVAIQSSQTICSGGTITAIALTGTVSSATYNWTRDNTAAATGIAASGSGNITGALTNTITAPVTVTFTITPTANGCTGAPVSATVIVNPRPTSFISGGQSICTGNPLSSISIALTGIAPWNFTYSDGTIAVSVTGNNTNPYTFTPPALPAIYTVTSLNDANCTAQAADRTGSAVLSQLSYTITASAGTNGSISPSGATGINCGTNRTYSITANAGFVIQNVLVDGVSQGAISIFTFTNVTANRTISATFSSAAFTIVASAGANGSITPSGSVAVASGGNQTFSIAANSCYQIADILVNGISLGAVSTYTFSNVTAPQTISASFSQLSYIITASAGGNGTITPSGATSINCGTNRTYSITANAGFVIQNVLVDGVSQGAISTFTFTNVTANRTISATFSSAAFTIVASAGANGSITPSGSVAVASGGNQTFSIAANSCYQIADVLVNGVSVGAVSTYTFSNVTAPQTINASFSQLSYIITASAGANGTITPNGATGINCGTNRTYSITANTGFVIQKLLVDGVSQGAISTFTFTNVTANRTISATFATAATCTTAPAAPTGIEGQVYGVCGGGNFTYSIKPVPSAESYVWTAPPGCGITSGQGTITIQLSVPVTFTGNGDILVSARNICGTSASIRQTIYSTLSYASGSSIIGPSIVSQRQANVQYSLPATAGATFNWRVPKGSAITSGQGTNLITVTFGTSSGNISVSATNACGTGGRVNKQITLTAPKNAAVDFLITTKAYFSINPNPSLGNTTAVFNCLKAGNKFELVMSDAFGKTLFTKSGLTIAGKNMLGLDLSKLPGGIYLVKLITKDINQTQKLFKTF